MAAVSVRLRWAVFSTVAVLVLGIAGAAGGLVVNARHVAVAESETQVTRFTAGAEAALNRALLGLDVLLASTDDMIDLWSDRMPRSDPEFIGKLLRSASRQNILVRSAVLLDPRRNVVAASDAMGARMLQELPAGFFDEAMAQGMPTLALSAPTVSFASSERILYAARPIRSAGGERLLAVLQVPVSMLSAVLAQGADIPGLEVTLERGKGELIIGTSGRGEARSRARVPRWATRPRRPSPGTSPRACPGCPPWWPPGPFSTRASGSRRACPRHRPWPAGAPSAAPSPRSRPC